MTNQDREGERVANVISVLDVLAVVVYLILEYVL